MTIKQTAKLQELVNRLREIFQIDRPELDFGIYKVLNARATEISYYLEHRLAAKAKAVLSKSANTQYELLARELKDKEAQYQADGIEPDTVPKIQELRRQLAQENTETLENENAVFSHLLTFFSRYYDQGDFISQRRYKGDTYAIPYAGEEVILHWANKDQYYTKSGENFTNYSFKLKDGRAVNFRLIAADVAKDNRKDNDKERRFVIATQRTVIRIDDNGDEYEEKLLPVEEVKGTNEDVLLIRFEYSAQPKGMKQETLITKAVETILDHPNVKSRWLDLTNRAPTEKNPQRTLLEKHLFDYTTKNTADYFIHKDLGAFLRRELDFYIKNEVMNLDDVQNASSFSDIEKNLRMIQCFRSIALELIDFLAQIENFQKKLWLKKKFVVSSHYCITVDRIPEEMYPEIIDNEAQWSQWNKLGVWNKNAPGTIDDLKSSLYRMVDTSLFSDTFKAKVLRASQNLDKNIDGILIHSDNFQALNLMQERYKEKVKYIYIDPPYNTNSTPILYKNEYKHSSWASLMQDRLQKGMKLLKFDGVKTVAIDDSEMVNLSTILEEVAPEHTLSRITVVHNPKGSITRNFNRIHEYALFLTRDGLSGSIARTLEENSSPRKMRRWGENSRRIDRRLSFYPIYLQNGKIVDIGVVPEDDFHPSGKNVIMSDGRIEVWPIDQDGVERRWNFGLDSIRDNLDRIAAINTKGEWDLFVTHEQTVPKTVWSGGEFDAGKYGNSLLINMLGEKRFDFPKSINLVKKCVSLATQGDSDAIILDYFGGSGTTAHAVIDLKRQAISAGQKSNTSFILVEQGEYFDKVTKPRVIKAVYSQDWSEGKPVSSETGISQCFKIIKLESYEDTLNNLQLSRSTTQDDLFEKLPQQAKDDYLLHYMLEVESRDSLLSVKDFQKPFDYMLNIAIDSAGAFAKQKIDLIETFNYLIGLEVNQIDAHIEKGYATVTGILPNGESCLVLWRDCDKLDYEGVNKLCDLLAINPINNKYDVVYINGDHNIPNVFTQTMEEGGNTRTLKLRQIESEFLSRMFFMEDN
ncbi:putative methyltransferase [Enterobacter ludwigii]|uniref:DNA methyltransferase n=1 Tax=Enterobacter TaxID=547 RepID=UPI00084FA7B7|nr:MULTISPECIES: DNA methyltransferase [Enterobacterales]MCE1431992.1 site-specific DNA-methyltransferase [Enterobacter hormaechei]HAV1775422.1 site-specific DNA-methyltransferase [Enterobacter hormaechei subsp. xiangfangensis]MCE1528385.1 site-specific DNA-methyltransferase [Enterobacter hormaechei]MDU7481580.1 DNA methyltransferase [Hafnia alvei]OEI71469.1 DNA methylase [Enterobacter sp. ku-bf2]